MSLKALFLVENDFEDLELFYPLYRLQEEGVKVRIASSSKESRTGKHGYAVTPDLTYGEVRVEDFDILVLPGGRSPERVRIHERAVEIVKEFYKSGKMIFAICHGPQLLISAGLIKGTKVTGWIGIRDDLKACGGIYEDREVVRDKNIITSRMPSDLPFFCKEMIKEIREIKEFHNG
jgi:protease I